MLNFIGIMVAVYLALVAAGITMVMVIASKWYVKLATKITMNTVRNLYEED